MHLVPSDDGSDSSSVDDRFLHLAERAVAGVEDLAPRVSAIEQRLNGESPGSEPAGPELRVIPGHVEVPRWRRLVAGVLRGARATMLALVAGLVLAGGGWLHPGTAPADAVPSWRPARLPVAGQAQRQREQGDKEPAVAVVGNDNASHPPTSMAAAQHRTASAPVPAEAQPATLSPSPQAPRASATMPTAPPPSTTTTTLLLPTSTTVPADEQPVVCLLHPDHCDDHELLGG